MRDGPRAAAYARLYLRFGLLAVLLLVLAVPPYQGPDELMHFKRADLVSRAGLTGQRVSATEAGGAVDPAIDASATEFNRIPFHTERKVTREMIAAAAALGWGEQPAAPSGFSNTAVYPPFLYLPAAAGVLIGKLANLSVVTTLYLSRAASGVVSVSIGAFAISIAGGAAPWLFVMLALPMSLSLMAAVSQDGPMIALTALAVAIFIAAREGQGQSKRMFVVMCASIALAAMGRPFYAVLAVLPFVSASQRWPARIMGAAAIVVSVGVWMQIVASLAPLAIGPEADPAAQLDFLRGHPLELLWAVLRTAKLGFFLYLESFIGRLGFLDTELPLLYHVFASAALIAGAIGAAASLKGHVEPLAWLLVAGAVACGAIGIFVGEYLMWTKPGFALVTGVQGRYFIPLALALPVLLPSLRHHAYAPRLARFGFAALCVFAPVTLAVTLYAVVARYYFSS